MKHSWNFWSYRSGNITDVASRELDSPTIIRFLPRETGLILRCARKPGNAFQTTQGNRLPCRDQEGRRGSEEAVPGPSVFPSGDPGVSGDFWVHPGAQA